MWGRQDVKQVVSLLKQGSSPNFKDEGGWTPLQRACSVRVDTGDLGRNFIACNQVSTAHRALSHTASSLQARCDARTRGLTARSHSRGVRKRCAMRGTESARAGCCQIIELLIKAGAGLPPYMLAAPPFVLAAVPFMEATALQMLPSVVGKLTRVRRFKPQMWVRRTRMGVQHCTMLRWRETSTLLASWSMLVSQLGCCLVQC